MGEHRLGFAWLGGDRGQGVRHRGHPERALPYIHQPACCRRGVVRGEGTVTVVATAVSRANRLCSGIRGRGSLLWNREQAG